MSETNLPFTLPDLENKWQQVINFFKELTGKAPSLEGVLFLIGVQELGQGTRTFTKEEKQELMHIAVCRLLSRNGYFKFSHHDKDGWPHFTKLKTMDAKNILEQETLLKTEAVYYMAQFLGN